VLLLADLAAAVPAKQRQQEQQLLLPSYLIKSAAEL
jgi:hypothetical protein